MLPRIKAVSISLHEWVLRVMRGEIRLTRDDTVCTCQVEGLAANFEACNHDAYAGVSVEFLDSFMTLNGIHVALLRYLRQ